jgi:hypothetical protein
MAFTLTRAKAQRLTEVLYLGSVAFYFVALFMPPLVIMLIGLFTSTSPTEAQGGVLGFADSYPAFDPQSWLLWVPAVVMLFLALWTIPLPLAKFPGTSRASLINASALMTFFGLILSTAFVGAPGIDGEAVIAALVLAVAFVLFVLRALIGLFRLVPRSWREAPPATRKRTSERTGKQATP